MIDVKQAVKTSRNYISGLFIGEEILDLSLEEVESSADGKYWLVTLGFTKQMAQPLNPIGYAQKLLGILSCFDSAQHEVRSFTLSEVEV